MEPAVQYGYAGRAAKLSLRTVGEFYRCNFIVEKSYRVVYGYFELRVFIYCYFVSVGEESKKSDEPGTGTE